MTLVRLRARARTLPLRGAGVEWGWNLLAPHLTEVDHDLPIRDRKRPLEIPTGRDRVVQAATKLVIDPTLEADFKVCSFTLTLSMAFATVSAGIWESS